MDPQARMEFTTLCSKHFFTTLDSAWEHVLPGPGPSPGLSLQSPRPAEGWAQSGTPRRAGLC